MWVSARIAYDALTQQGWQDAAATAWERWQRGQRYDPPPGIDRYTAAKVAAANCDLDRQARLFRDWPGDLQSRL